jgi:hypothetical protein
MSHLEVRRWLDIAVARFRIILVHATVRKVAILHPNHTALGQPLPKMQRKLRVQLQGKYKISFGCVDVDEIVNTHYSRARNGSGV